MSDKSQHIDQHLIKSLKKGDLLAFDELFKKYSKKLLYFARSYIDSKEDAEGLVQEVFLKIWEKRNELKEYESFNGFIYTITFNSILKYFRKKARERKHVEKYLEGFEEVYDNTSQEVEYNNLRELVDRKIDQLPEKRKQIFLLSRRDGFSNNEIAEQLQISKKTVENQLTSALKFLREQLNNENILMALFFYLFIY